MITAKSKQQRNGTMRALSAEMEAHYTRPFPAATAYTPNWFPALLDRGLLAGLFAGALLGAGLGWLVHSGRLTPLGWEGLFALVPFTFYAFFIFLGAASGLAIGGVATLLVAPVPSLRPTVAEGDADRGVRDSSVRDSSDRVDIYVDTTTYPDAAGKVD